MRADAGLHHLGGSFARLEAAPRSVDCINPSNDGILQKPPEVTIEEMAETTTKLHNKTLLTYEPYKTLNAYPKVLETFPLCPHFTPLQ